MSYDVDSLRAIESRDIAIKVLRELLQEERNILRAAFENGAPPMYFLDSYLDWVADRFVNVYSESPNTDFVLAAQRWAKKVYKWRTAGQLRQSDGQGNGEGNGQGHGHV